MNQNTPTPPIPSVLLPSSMSGYNTDRMNTPFSINMSYYNCSNKLVHIVQRNGCVINIGRGSNGSYSKPAFVIHVEYNTKYINRVDILNVLDMIDNSYKDDFKELDYLRANLLDAINSQYCWDTSLFLDYVVTIDSLQECGGAVYLPELDLVVTINDTDAIPYHPHSKAANRLQMIKNISEANQSLGIQMGGQAITIIDNHGVYGDRFIKLGNEVVKIRAIKDFSRDDGVYIITHGRSTSDYSNNDPILTKYTYREADQHLGLHKKYELALTHGDIVEAERAIKIKALEHDTAVLRKQMDQDKHNFQQEAMRREQELKERLAQMEEERARRTLEREKEQAELEKQRAEMKDHYERKSQNRKETSEVIKLLPTVILGVAAAISAFIAIKNGKKS